MTAAEEKELHRFETRMRQLMLEFGRLRQENASLRRQVGELEERCQARQEALDATRKEYSNLKLGRMMDISTTDLYTANKRLAKLAREIDKCIALLSV